MSDQDNKYRDIGTRISQSVTDALASGNFGKLNEDITSSVREVLNDVGNQINNAFGTGGMTNGYKYRDVAAEEIARHHDRREELRQKALNARSDVKNRSLAKVKFKEVGSVLGILDIIGGGALFVVGLVITLVVGIFSAASIPWPLLISLAGVILGSVGASKLKWLSFAKRLRKLCSEKMYNTVDAIASATGLSKKKTVKNIKKVLEKGFFPEGYLDEENTTFMVSQEMYDRYLETKENSIVLQAQSKETETVIDNSPEGRLNSMIAEGMRYVDQLRELNAQIPGVQITNKLSRLEKLLNEIFNGLREHPDEMDNCHKLMDYYLPTMIKLVEAYAEYDKVSQPGDDIIEAKKEIENTLDVINQAFVELLNKLYQSSVWDVKAEAKVLQTMLHQAGLTEENAVAADEEEEMFIESNSLEEQVVNRV